MKTFVLDTNVLLHSADALSSFADNEIVLPMAVIEELDRFKSNSNELGRNARRVIRSLDELREKGSLGKGVPTPSGGKLRIITSKGNMPGVNMDSALADNRIINVAWALHEQEGLQVVFVSKDINARLKADALGLDVVDFEKQKVNFDELFCGYREIDVAGDVIDKFYKGEDVAVPDIELYPNEFALLRNETNPKNTALAREHSDGTKLVSLSKTREHACNIKPRSSEQRMALELLLDPTIQIVTLVGQAGTGKTLLALAAALEQTIHHSVYEKILVSRPIIPMGNDIGYLPGSKDEKLQHWMQPIFDNLTYLLGGKTHGEEEAVSVRKKIEDMMKEHVLELEALTYIRGRSIPKQFVIIDEAQNLTPHEVKTIISRAGEGTKMVLTGDPYQIDSPYLDASSNGLTYTVEALKGQAIHGHITLRKSERSELAAIAAELL